MAQSLCDSETVTEMGRLCFFTVLCSPGSSSLDAGFCPGPERRAARRCLILLPHLRSLPFHGTAITPAVLEKSSCSWPDTTMSGNGFSLSGKDMFYPLFFFFFLANLHSLESLKGSRPPACGFARAVVTKPFPPGAVYGTQPSSKCTSTPSL